MVAMNDPFAHKRGVQRIAHRAVDTLVGARWGSIRNVRTDRPLAALTFDDGPDAQWTPRILDILAEHRVHATFFMLVENAAASPSWYIAWSLKVTRWACTGSTTDGWLAVRADQRGGCSMQRHQSWRRFQAYQ